MTEEADALYGLPLDEFTAAANELAKSQQAGKAPKGRRAQRGRAREPVS